MKKLMLTVAVIFFLTAKVSAENRLAQVAVTGADSLTVSELTPRLLSKTGGILNDGYIAHDSGLILGSLRERGWWNAGLTAVIDSSSAETSLSFKVARGSQIILGKLSHSLSDSSELLPVEIPDRTVTEPLTRKILDAATSAIVRVYSSEGFPDITVEPRLTAHEGTVDVELFITSGAQALIDSLMVTGLTKTQPHTVRRELTPLLGRPANRKTVQEARLLLAAVRHVRIGGEISVAYAPNGAGILVIPLEEGSQGAFDGVIGYQPSQDDGKGEIIGTADISLNNLLGTGRAAKFRWKKLGGNSEDLELAYMEPWIFGRPYNVSGDFMQEEREGQGYVRTTLSSAVNRHFGALSLSLGWRYEKVSADSVNSSTAQGIETGVVWRTTDDPLNPRSGAIYSLDWSMVSKKFRFSGSESSTLERLEIDLDHFIPVRRRQTAALLLRYRRALTDRSTLGPSDRYWLGGAGSIRGHAENMHPAVKAFWGSLEYRLLTGERSRAFLFYDTAWLTNYVASGGAVKKDSRTVSGYGFGLRIASKTGVVGFDYGLSGDGGFADGKLHVSMRTEF